MPRVLPSALYLKHTNGEAIGPLSMTAVEVLFDSRVVTAKTPISFDGDRFSAIDAWPEVLKRLESIKSKLNEGKKVWGKDAEPDKSSEPKKSRYSFKEPAPSGERIARASESTVVGRMLRLAVQQRAGQLKLHASTGGIYLTYKDGKVISVATEIETLSIANFLVRTGALDEATVQEGLKQAPAMGGDLGGALIASGKIQPHVYFEKFLDWAKEVLGAAVSREFAEVLFEELEPTTPPFPLGLDRLAVPLQAVRSGMTRARLTQTLQSKMPCPVIISQVEGVTLEDVKLKPRELRALRAIDGVKTLAQIMEDLGGSEEKALPVLQALFFAEQAGFLAFGDDPLHRKELSEAQTTKTLFERLAKQNYFEVLGVSQGSSDEEVRSRYADYAKKYHPDTVRTEAATELLDARRKIFDLMGKAAAALATEDNRFDYASNVERGILNEEEALKNAQGMLQSETLFKKAGILLKVRKYAEAETHLNQAIMLNPDDAEFQMMLAYIGYLQGAKSGDAEAAASAAAEALAPLRTKNPDILAGHLYMGHIQTALNKPDGALKAFKKVLELDPNHPEATSQVRVGRMRKDRKTKKRWI